MLLMSEEANIQADRIEALQNTVVNSTYLWYIVPGYMEESRLLETIDYLSSLQPQLKTKGFEMLFVLVDDGSSDNTYKIMKKFADSTGNVALRIRHGGRGAALQAGVRFMRNAIPRTDDLGIIAFSAADLKLPLEDILESCRYICEEGWSGVFLSKNLSGSLMVRSFSRRFLSLLFNKLVRLFFNFKYMDTQGVKFLKLDEKVFKILEKCTDNTFTYDTEVAIELNLNGVKIKEIPYHLEDSSETDSKVNLYASVFMGLGLIKLLKKTTVQRMNLFMSKFHV